MPRGARIFHYGTLALGTLVLSLLARGQWFFGDEWDPIAQRSVFGSAQKNLLEPHNEHWSTLAVVVYRTHLAVFGLRTYVPLMILFIATCVLTAHLLWRLCLRTGSEPYVAAVLALGFLVFGPAATEVVFAWNVTFVGALACGFAILVLVDDHGPVTPRDRWVVWGLGVMGILCSGIAITMLLVVGAALLWTRGWRVALESLSVPVAVYALWSLVWGREGGSLLSTAGLEQVPDVVGTGLTFVFDDLTHVPFTGVVVLASLMAYVLITRRSWTGTRAFALCMAAGAVAFYAIIAIRRSSPYLPGPKTGRYLWMAFALLVPLTSLAVSALVRRWRVAAAIGVVGAAVLVGIQVDDLVDDARVARELKEAERRRVVAAAGLAAAGLPMVEDSVLANSVFEDSARVDLLARLAREGRLPEIRTGVADRLGARADLQVAFDSWPSDATDPPARVIGLYEATASRGPDGCVVVRSPGPTGHVRFAADPLRTTATRVEGDFTDGLGLAVVRNGTTGPWRPLIPLVARPYRLRLAAADSDVLMATGPGRVIFCNVVVDPAVYSD